MIFVYRGDFFYSVREVGLVTRAALTQMEMGTTPSGRKSISLISYESELLKIVIKGVWLCEAALWVEWENQGNLSTRMDGCFFALEFDNFKSCVAHFPESLVAACVYAQMFVESLRSYPSLTDMINLTLVDTEAFSHTQDFQ